MFKPAPVQHQCGLVAERLQRFGVDLGPSLVEETADEGGIFGTPDIEAPEAKVSHETNLVYEDEVRHNPEAENFGQQALFVNEYGVHGSSPLDKRPYDLCTLSILSYRDQLEDRVGVMLVELLPDRQLLTARSPRTPKEEHERFPAERLEGRVGEARVGGIAKLADYEIRFHKLSKDGSGKADAVPVVGKETWGVVFELTQSQLDRLRAHEVGYNEVELSVQLGGEPVGVWTYLAQPDAVRHDLRPTREYLNYLINGAREHGLPVEYIQMLEEVEVAEPPERAPGQQNNI